MTLDEWIDELRYGDLDSIKDRQDCIELLEFLEELKKRRNGGSSNSDAREDFMFIVCQELSDDADNCRANRIIDAADTYADSF